MTTKRSTEVVEGHGELILVVDDERAVRELVSEGLTSHGYRVLVAASGEEALQMFQQHRHEVRVLLTDSAMPVMNGLQVIAEIRKAQPELPAILASGEAGTDALTVSQATMLAKPFSLEELLSVVGRELDRH